MVSFMVSGFEVSHAEGEHHYHCAGSLGLLKDPPGGRIPNDNFGCTLGGLGGPVPFP